MFGIHSTVNLFECGDVEVLIGEISVPDQHFSKGTANVKGIFMNHFKTVFILAIIIALLYPPLTMSQLPGIRLQDADVLNSAISGLKLNHEADRDFHLGTIHHRLPADIEPGIEKLSPEETKRHFQENHFLYEDVRKRNSLQRELKFPEGQVSVVDTAIVFASDDTIRHVYSFNALAKMTLHLTQLWKDSAWVDSLRDSSSYDATGNKLSYVYEQWSGNHWLNVVRYTNSYDVNSNVLSQLYEQWLDDQWVNNDRSLYTYDQNKHMLSDLEESWSDAQWVNVHRSTYTYDVNGKELTYLFESWSNDQWVNAKRSTSTYDANGNELTYLDETWSGDQWLYSDSIVCTYDTYGDVLTSLYERWLNGQWVNYARTTSTYDAKGKLLTYLYESWSNNQWVNSEYYTCSYDAMGRKLSDLIEKWSNGQWVNYARYSWTYDANGNELSWLHEDWFNGQWENFTRTMNSYDMDGNLTTVYIQRWGNSSWGPGLGYVSELDNACNSYNFGSGYKFEFMRATIITGTVDQRGENPTSFALSQNYPNPFNPATTINYQLPAQSYVTLRVFDVLGREVATLVNGVEQAGNKTVSFDAHGLASGVYYYRLQSGDFVATKKLLLVR
jgi:hypothetical protein